MTGGKQIHLEDVGVKRKAISHDKSEHEENQAHAGNQADRPAESTAKPAKSTEKNTPSERMSPPEQAGPEAKRQKAEEAPAAAKGEVIEQGKIVFFYRPRVQVSDPQGLDDIQRLLIIGKKRLPDSSGNEKFFGFVAGSNKDKVALIAQLSPDAHETGVTEQPRAAGEGIYEIVNSHSTQLAYKLQLPEAPGKVQEELHIGAEGTFKVSIKNPEVKDPPNLGLKEKAQFSAEQQKHFRGLRWTDCQDPSMLSTEHCEFLLIGASTDVQGELGDAGEHLKKAAALDTHLPEDSPADEHQALITKLKEDLVSNKHSKSSKETSPSKGAKRDNTEEEADGIVEEGRIFFCYRPRVAVEHAESLDDVQRFSMILTPTSRAADAPSRLIIIGKKRLPSVSGHERFFGFVAGSNNNREELVKQLGRREQDTKTRGKRVTEAARVAGEGTYEIVVRQDGSSTNLAYKLELPEQPGAVQKELNIESEGSFKISVKNPETGNPPNAGLEEKADFDKRQMHEFKGKRTKGLRWISVQDPTLLDKPHCEILLIGASRDVEGELGAAGKHLKESAEDDVLQAGREASDDMDEHQALMAKLKEELGDKLPDKPADTGAWA
eukprot:jgi/Astpho2/121/Aster-04586